MKKITLLLFVLPVVCLGAHATPKAGNSREPVDYVDPFIGATEPGLRWMLFPGPAMPFGMVKLSPDNRRKRHQAGYDYRINTISGFSHIHSWTMGGLLMMPATGPLKLAVGPESGSPDSFRSHYRHETESASPGYYAVTLDDYHIRAELTSTTRAGFQRYTFPKSDQARILMVLNVPDETDLVVKEARIRRVSATEIEGLSDQIESSVDSNLYSYQWQQYSGNNTSCISSSGSASLSIPWAAGWERPLLRTQTRSPERATWAPSPAITLWTVSGSRSKQVSPW